MTCWNDEIIMWPKKKIIEWWWNNHSFELPIIFNAVDILFCVYIWQRGENEKKENTNTKKKWEMIFYFSRKKKKKKKVQNTEKYILF